MRQNMKRNVAVIGLGYVGFPVAISFSKLSKTIGFDIDEDRVAELKMDMTELTKVLSQRFLRKICGLQVILTS